MNPAVSRGISQLHEDYRAGMRSVRSVVEACLARVNADRALGAFLSEFADSARSQADQMDARLNQDRAAPWIVREPLWGVPVAIKDNLHVVGEITTCGSRILENYRAPFDATAVARLSGAGAVFIGKTNLDEFAMGGSGENSAFGPTLNPLRRDRVPGGSSSGSAAAVAADMAVAALGSDTGGSIRLPASFCGIVGLKPTYGRVSRHGLVAFASSLDQVGPMARTVSDAMAVFEAIHGHDPKDATSARLPALRIDRTPWSSGAPIRVGIPEEFFSAGVQAEVRAAIDGVLDRWKSQGATLVPISLPHSIHSIPVYYVIAMAEVSSNLSRFDGVRFGARSDRASQAESLEQFYSEARSLFGREAKRRILLGSFVLSAGYHDAYYRKACQVRRLIAEDFQNAFAQVDVIASPVSPTTAYGLGSQDRTPLQMYLNDLFTIPANLTGLPALSIPVGSDSEGMPIGMQLIAPAFREDLLLRAGLDVEALR